MQFYHHSECKRCHHIGQYEKIDPSQMLDFWPSENWPRKLYDQIYFVDYGIKLIGLAVTF